MELSYNASPAGLTFATQYNGNISGMRWSNGSDGTKKSYGFEYDGLNRIKKALFKERSATSWNVSPGYFDVDSIDYDKNGNIEALRRKEANVIIDQLAYAYHDLGNKLKNVDDGTNNSSGFSNVTGGGTEYWYDENGNMRKDINKHIDSIRYNQLNLPEEIIFENGNRIKYYYDAGGTKWRKVVNDTSTTDYVGNMILENDTLKIIHTAEGRIVVNQNKYKYQYTLKDHLGNVRLTFGAEPDTVNYTATMESELASEEEAQFANIADYRQISTQFNHTTGGVATPNESVMLNSTLTVNGEPRTTAAMKSLKLQVGDTVNMEVWAKHPGVTGSGLTGINTFLFTALTSGFGLVAGGETAQAYNAFTSLIGTKALIDQDTDDDPVAYLNYIFFDDNYANPVYGLQQISSAADDAFEQLSLSFTATTSGYLYVYVSNESTLDVNVYFDDLKITHKSSLSIVQADDYYPFGLSFNSYQDTTETRQNYLYNGVERQEETSLYQTYFRNYNPALGRFQSIDPLTPIIPGLSPYHFAYNNPVVFNDPLGLIGGDGNNNRIAPGSGNHWSDGIKYSDWSLSGGSETYRTGLASGLTDIGGTLYRFNSDGTRDPLKEKNGQAGFWEDIGFTDYWYEEGEFYSNPGVMSVFHPLRVQNGETCSKGNEISDFGYLNFIAAQFTIWGSTAAIAANNARPLYTGVKEWANTVKGAKGLGVKLGVVGLFITGTDILFNGPNTSNKLDAGAGLISIFGAPLVGGLYFVGNIATYIKTGQTIGEHIDNYYWIPTPGGGYIPISKNLK